MELDQLRNEMKERISSFFDFMESDDVPDKVKEGFNHMTHLMDVNNNMLSKSQEIISEFNHIINYIGERIEEELKYAETECVTNLDDNAKSGLLMMIMASVITHTHGITRKCSDIGEGLDDFLMLKDIELENKKTP
jgi:hypothetical protein